MNALDLTQAVFIQNQQIKTDSLKVAQAFGKRHTNILRAIENLDCAKSFTQLNFELSDYIDSTGRVLPKYEMTQDGWMFLVMGFTGEKAAQVKVAFINAFKAMATLLENNQLLEQQGIYVGAKVRLNSGSPELTVNQLIANHQGELDKVELLWFSNRLHKTVLSIHAVTPVIAQQNQLLDHFWQSVYRYGLSALNHSHKPDLIALYLPHLYEIIQDLPEPKRLQQELSQSTQPYPHYFKSSHAVRSILDNKTHRCMLFKPSQALLGGAA